MRPQADDPCCLRCPTIRRFLPPPPHLGTCTRAPAHPLPCPFPTTLCACPPPFVPAHHPLCLPTATRTPARPTPPPPTLAPFRTAGTIPAAALALPSLLALSLSNNQLTGDLAAAAQALAARQNNPIFSFSVAGNQLSGELPQQLSSLALFDASRPAPLAPFSLGPLPRVFNISGNQLTGAFPTYLLTQLPKLAANCTNGRCTVAASVTGPSMSLACPTGEALQNADSKYNTSVLATQQLECLSPSGQRVPVAPYLQSGGTYRLPSGGVSLSAGATAGLVVGVVVVACLAASGVWWFISRRKKNNACKQEVELKVASAEQV
jgi:hypothetical protein